MVPVPYDELPLKLPNVENFEPGQDGESPVSYTHLDVYKRQLNVIAI